MSHGSSDGAVSSPPSDQSPNGGREEPTSRCLPRICLSSSDRRNGTDSGNYDGDVKPMRWKSSAPEKTASFPSRLLFVWVQPLFTRASYLHRRGKALEQDDLIPLPTQDHADTVVEAFEDAWSERSSSTTELEERNDKKNETKAEATDKRTSVVRKEAETRRFDLETRLRQSLFRVIGRRLVAAGFIKLLNTCLQFTFPLLLNAILRFIERTQRGDIDDDDPWERNAGYWLSALLLAAMAAKATTENWYFHNVYRCGYQARVAVSTAVYAKALRLSSAERQGTTLGELVNLMQVDATKIEMFVPQTHVLWDGLVQICGYMTILYTLIGWPCFAGLVIMIFAGPLQGKIMKKLFGLNRQMIQHTDARVKTTNEALQGVRCVKMYTWEDSFERSIATSRDEELGFLKRVAYLRGFSRAYMGSVPGIVAVTSFVVYAYATDGEIEASTLFAALVAFDQLRFPLLFYPMAFAQLAQAKVSSARVAKFLGMKEVCSLGEGRYSREDVSDGRNNVTAKASSEDNGVANGETEGKGEIIVDDADIYWSDPSAPISSNKAGDALSIKEAKVALDTEDGSSEAYPKPILSDVSLRVSAGELCAVVGMVGCGKSSLCSAVLNETVLGDGHISVKGSVAYAAQSPWILNATVRDNILFGLPMDQERYDRIIEACQLKHDLYMLDDGDLTEIGERGINLSGGQKQRISVARAAYSNADVIILDDPLSALDPEVGKKLFEDCILGVMAGKTRLLITNQLQCLKHCHSVVALGNGRVIEHGAFSDLVNQTGGEVQRLLEDLKRSATDGEHASTENGSNTTASDGVAVSNLSESVTKAKETASEVKKPAKEATALTTREERAVGAVKLSVYKKYLKAGGGYLRFAFVYFAFVLCTAVGLMNNVWVSIWTSDSTYERRSQGFYLGLYATTAVALGFVTFLRSFLLARFGVSASKRLHQNLLGSVLHAPMSFFDTTPTGRILSRFSKDMHSIDEELSDYLDFFLFCTLFVLVSLGTITFATPLFGVAVIPIMFLYIRVLNYFREVSRETKRLESLSRSPVYSHFSETLGGLATIRAYGQPKRFVGDFESKLDQNIRAYYCNKSADRWLSVRLELIGALIAGLAAVFSSHVVISGAASGKGSDSNFASVAGLSLTYAISVTGLLNWCVRSFAQLEAAMNSCERVLYYTEAIPQEAAATTIALEAHAAAGHVTRSDPSAFAVVAAGGIVIHPSKEWPPKGLIKLNNLFMRYREGTPTVLKGLNATIAGGERIGVVGRTGSGKSSLLLCLMRIVEPEIVNETKYEAPIEIDGVDILRIGLNDLRSKIGIIPQSPVLFSGSVRTNLDPFNQFTDGEIWSALDQCGMKAAVDAMPEKLSASVAEYGDNLSQGQRQLLCLGRALLKKCRILLLDEATSSVDFETDRAIQRTLREAFTGSTVLTIAHRVNTIMDSDKILVMKDGVAAEFAPPGVLLKDERSLFSDIVRHSKAERH